MSSFNRSSPVSQPLSMQPPLPNKPGPTLFRPRRSYRRNLLLDLPIAGRLALGFTLAALIAAVAAGVIGFQRSQSLTRQSDFYQTLLQTNTSLTTGANFLQLMNSELHTTINDASVAQPSKETLAQDQVALQGLVTRYDATLTNYTSTQLLEQHPDQVALLEEADHANQVMQQRTLAGSALRTWTIYRNSQARILQDVLTGNLIEAPRLERSQGELTNADAQSALRALIQFDGQLATSIRDAANVEQQNQFVTTIIAALLACLCIGGVGLLISNTLVHRLRVLQRVSRMVERGQLESRVSVIGRDEIADVSLSINSMLDTIVGLLEETRSQRDALTNAARHLFSYMQVVSAGEFRIGTTASEDPIGMLTDAFNFTVGRFRRFISRTQTNVGQLEVISRQGMDRAEAFMHTLHTYTPSLPTTGTLTKPATSAGRTTTRPMMAKGESKEIIVLAQAQHTHERLVQISRDVIKTHTIAILSLTDSTTLAMARLHQRVAPTLSLLTNQEYGTQQMQELQAVESLLQQLGTEIRTMQTETIRGLTEVDRLVVQSMNTLNSGSKEPTQPLPGAASESPELTRLGINFVQDIMNLARDINAVAQEMRASTATFKVESGQHTSRPLVQDVPRPIIHA